MKPYDISMLSNREKEVLTLIAEGKSLLEISQELHRSLKTIESHRLSLGRKLKVKDRLDLAKIAIANGMVPVPSAHAVQAPAYAAEGAKDDPLAKHWLDQIFKRTYDRAGNAYLNELTAIISKVIGVEHVGVSVPDLEKGCQVFRTLAYISHGEIEDQFAYGCAETPCDVVLEKGFYLIGHDVMDAFPKDSDLKAISAQCYAGIRLDTREGLAVGVLWMIDDKPLEQVDSIERMLRALMPRVAAMVEEVNRVQREIQLLEERTQELAEANRVLREKYAKSNTSS